jgi:hypothetical protein
MEIQDLNIEGDKIDFILQKNRLPLDELSKRNAN